MKRKRKVSDKELLKFDGVDSYVTVENLRWNLVELRYYPRALSKEEVEGLATGRIKPLRCRRCNHWFTNRSELMRHIWEFHLKSKQP